MRTFKLSVPVVCGLLVATVAWGQEQKVPGLLKELQSPDVKTRVAACLELSKLGPAAKDALPALINALQAKNDGQLRCAAAMTIGAIGSDAKDAVPALVDALTSDDQQLRAYAAHCAGSDWPGCGRSGGAANGTHYRQGSGSAPRGAGCAALGACAA